MSADFLEPGNLLKKNLYKQFLRRYYLTKKYYPHFQYYNDEYQWLNSYLTDYTRIYPVYISEPRPHRPSTSVDEIVFHKARKVKIGEYKLVMT